MSFILILLCIIQRKNSHLSCDNEAFSMPRSNYAFSLFSTFQTWWLASIPLAREWSCRTFKRACSGCVTDATKTNSSSLPMTHILAGWPQPVCWTMTPWPLQTSLATSALWVWVCVKDYRMVDQESMMNASSCIGFDWTGLGQLVDPLFYSYHHLPGATASQYEWRRGWRPYGEQSLVGQGPPQWSITKGESS